MRHQEAHRRRSGRLQDHDDRDLRCGPVVAAIKGDVGNVARFRSRDRFASYNGMAPIEVSPGARKITSCHGGETGG